MTARIVTWAAVLAAACAIGATPAATQGDRVALLLSRAREALGGSAALNAVQSLVVRGTTTRGAGHTQSHGEFEISTLLPDRYVRPQTHGVSGVES